MYVLCSGVVYVFRARVLFYNYRIYLYLLARCILNIMPGSANFEALRKTHKNKLLAVFFT